jgi:cell division control protein 6
MFNNRNEESLDSIFDRALSGKHIVNDRHVLSSDYIPDKLPFREKQITDVAQTLAPLLKSIKCSNLLLYGKTGTGKTVVARYVISKLANRASSNNLEIHIAYSNTRVAGTTYRVLSDLANTIKTPIPFTGLSVGEVLQRITNRISSEHLFVVLVLDEIDYLVKTHGDNLLYELTRSNELLSPGFLCLVGISNDLHFKDYLDPRVLSSLSEEEIVFPPYTAEEIRSILLQRAEKAFKQNSIPIAAINLCAALSGSEHGDARRAVDLLRISSEVAEREGANNLEEKHVRIAVQKIERDRVTDAISSLPIQAKVVLMAVLSCNSSCSTGIVFQKYLDFCNKIGIEKLTQRRVSGLLSELDIMGLINSVVVSHGRYGRTKKISSSISLQTVKEVFKTDTVLSQLF